MPIATQNFDGVTAPALPSGWTFDAPYTTTTSPSGLTPISSPNVLQFASTGSNGTYFATANAAPGAADVAGVGYVGLFSASGQAIRIGLTARLNSSSPTLATAAGYAFWFDWHTGTVGISRLGGGTDTTLVSVTPASIPTGWIKLAWSVVGTSLALAVQRLSDNDWLQPGGPWASGAQVNCLTATDSTVAGTGTWGAYVVQSGSGFTGYLDSLEIDAPGGGSGVLLPPWRIRRPASRPAGGRARIFATPREVGYVYATPHTPIIRPAARRGDAAPRMRRGRVFLPWRPPVPVPPAVVRPLDALRIVRRPGDDHRQARRMPGAVWPPPNSGQSTPPPPPPPPPLPIAYGPAGWNIARRRPWRSTWRGGWTNAAIGYTVYGNPGATAPPSPWGGYLDEIDYTAPLVTTSGTSWTASPVPGVNQFGVRASNVWGEEKNADAFTEIVLDANGNDITNRPRPPSGLRAFARGSGTLRVEWHYPEMRASDPTAPTGFNAYLGAGGAPDYSAPVATVPYNAGLWGAFTLDIAGLVGGTTYAAAVRAANASGEEPNATVVTAAALAAGPGAVDGLTATQIV